MVEVDISDTHPDTLCEPSVDESGPGLVWSCLVARESDEMDARVSIIIMHGESGNRLISMITKVTPNGTRIDSSELAIVFDVIGLEEVADFGTGKSPYKYLRIDGLDTDIAVSEEFLSGSLCSLVPFFVVFFIRDFSKSRSGEMGIDRETAPSWWDISPLEWHPDNHPTGPSVRYEEFSCRFGIDAFEFGKLNMFSDDIFDPSKTPPLLERDGPDTAVLTQIGIIDC